MKYTQEYYICDRCGKKFTLIRSGYGICFLDSSGNIEERFDLCLDCQDSLRNWKKHYDKKWQDYIKDKPHYKEDE